MGYGRNVGVAELTRKWDDRADSGIYFDSQDTASGVEGVPMWYVPEFRCILGPDHFLGKSVDVRWNTRAQNSPTGLSILDRVDGIMSAKLASTVEAEITGIDLNDLLQLDPSRHLVVKFGFSKTETMNANETIVIGVETAHNNTFDSVARHFWMRLQADDDIMFESDDATTDTDDKDSTKDLTAGQFTQVRLEFPSVNDCRAYVNGVRVLSDTTFKVGAGKLQFAALLQKASSSAAGELLLDYVACYQKK